MIKIVALLAFVLARFHGSDQKGFLTTFPGVFRTFRSPTSPMSTSIPPLSLKILTESGVGNVGGSSATSKGKYVDVNDDCKNYGKIDDVNSTTSSNNNNGFDNFTDTHIDSQHHHPNATSNTFSYVPLSKDEREEQRLIYAMQSAVFPCTVTLVKRQKLPINK